MTRWQISDLPESTRNKLPLATLKKNKPKSRHPEYDEQVQVVKWWYDMKKIKKIPAHYHLVYTDTSASRTPAQRGRYKAMGGRAGVLDLFIPVTIEIPPLSIYKYPGLWIEMKALTRVKEKNGGMSDEQLQFVKDMKKNGYAIKTCYTAKEAIDTINLYLGLD